MFEHDKLEAGGHTLTLVAGIRAGVSTYWCENCGAVYLSHLGNDEHDVFYVPLFSTATKEKCVFPPLVGEVYGDLHRARGREPLFLTLATMQQTYFEEAVTRAMDED